MLWMLTYVAMDVVKNCENFISQKENNNKVHPQFSFLNHVIIILILIT